MGTTAHTTGTAKMQDHAQRSHALLSASGAERWFNCTPSCRLEEQYGEPKKDTFFTHEGTIAHELAELLLNRASLSEKGFLSRYRALASDKLFENNEDAFDEMNIAVNVYVAYCNEQFAEAQSKDPVARMDLEQRLDLTSYVPESFGTADCVILGGGVLEVIDLKYGMGVAVDPTWNKQLMLYGLGALRKYDMMFDVNTVQLTIVQPRLGNIQSWQISVDELKSWAENELKEKAQLAFRGEGETNPGEWCRFCTVKNKCRKLAEQQMDLAKYDFKEPEVLSDEEIADIFLRAPKLVEWANGISEYALSKAVDDNKVWPGLKLVEGVSRRKWACNDDVVASTVCSEFPGLTEEELYDMKLKSLSSIEKLVGKKAFAGKLSKIVVKPQGKPTLVPESDKRPAIGLEQIRDDFR